jgi:hypothetical protein
MSSAKLSPSGPNTARGGFSRDSVQTAASGTGSGSGRSSSRRHRDSEIEKFADVRPTLNRWLRDHDELFRFAEQKTGLDREKVSRQPYP